MPSNRTRELVTAALLAALLAASAWVTIPIGPVPITLQVFVLAVVVLVCKPAGAAAAVGLYLAMGVGGLPVFSGAQGGVDALVGHTGGYLIGFLIGAVAASWLRTMLRAAPPVADVSALTLLVAVIYAAGTLWLAWLTGRTIVEAIVVGALPFLPVDALKCVAAFGVAAALRRAGLAPAASRA